MLPGCNDTAACEGRRKAFMWGLRLDGPASFPVGIPLNIFEPLGSQQPRFPTPIGPAGLIQGCPSGGTWSWGQLQSENEPIWANTSNTRFENLRWHVRKRFMDLWLSALSNCAGTCDLKPPKEFSWTTSAPASCDKCETFSAGATDFGQVLPWAERWTSPLWRCAGSSWVGWLDAAVDPHRLLFATFLTHSCYFYCTY
jgi:hypothetical protein